MNYYKSTNTSKAKEYRAGVSDIYDIKTTFFLHWGTGCQHFFGMCVHVPCVNLFNMLQCQKV